MLAIVAVALAVVFRQAVARAAIVAAIAATTGLHVSFGALQVGTSGLVARGIHVETASRETVADVTSATLEYSLRDVLPGGTHAFGLTGFDVEGAHLVVTRRRDGTLDVPLPKGGTGGAPTAPFAFQGRVRDASIDVYDFTQPAGLGRHLAIAGINADLAVATNARSRYRAMLTYVQDGRRYPIEGNGDVDVAAGFGVQRWRCAMLPIARLANVALDSPQLRFAAGSVRDFDATVVSLPAANGGLTQHASANATLEGARIAVGGLAKPVRDVRGRIAVYGNGLLLDGVTASLAGLPMRFDGGVYGTSAPQVHVTMSTHGDLAALRQVLPQTAQLPLHGPIRLDVTAEGAAAKPLVEIALRSPHASYAAYAVSKTSALLAFDGSDVDLVGFHTHYDGIDAVASGRLGTHAGAGSIEMLAGFDARSTQVPYAATMLPDMPLHGVVLASGNRPSLVTARGVLYGASRDAALAAAFDLRSDGVGTVGPLRARRGGASLYAIAGADRPHRTYDAYVRARDWPVALPRAAATLDSNVAAKLQGSTLRAAGLADLRGVRTAFGDVARVGLRLGRTPGSEVAAGLSARGIGSLGGVAAAVVAFDRGTLRIDDAAVASGGNFADVRGDVRGLPSAAPRYDLWTTLDSADLGTIASLVRPSAANLVEGSAKARLHVGGSGAAPSIRGTAAIPEGAVNGLAFHDLHANVNGTPSSIALSAGSVTVGSTGVAFDAVASATSQHVAVDAPRADLSDFNDFFDAGDMFGGEGTVRAGVDVAGGAVVATNGSVGLHDVSLRGLDFGATDATWRGSGDRIATTLAMRGPFGRVNAAGTIGLSGDVDVVAHARDLDLSRWSAATGMAVPVTGLADADLTAAGRYPNLDATLDATVAHASVGRVPIDRLTIAASVRDGRGRIASATLAMPHARVTGGGTFGMHPDDAIDVAFHATSPDVAALAAVAFGKTFDAAGALDTTLRVRGSPRHPVLDDAFALTNARYGKLAVPRVAGSLRADERSVSLVSGEIDLRKGRVTGRATVPIRAVPFAIDPHDRPVSAQLVADDVEASNVADLLPKGTAIAGRVDGRVDVSGSVRAPRLNGRMTLARGSFSGPQERVPITNVAGALAFSGTTVRLEDAGAQAGGGSLAADGSASIPNVRDLGRVAMALNLHARSVQLDLPQYVKGRFDGDVALTRAPGTRPLLSGTMTLDSARIPVTALYNPKASGAPAAPLPLGMNLQLAVGRDVRVVSPNVDVGIQGKVHAFGTLADPQLAGTIASTGGTVNFFRDFRVERATVSFDPSSGIVPDVDATATTFIPNPETNVALRVTGPATHLNVAFASDPVYGREQILGLLVNAQSLGAVQGVAATGGGSFSASSAISNLAAGQLDTLFTRNLLEPLSVALGGGLGLENMQLTTDIQGGLGVNAVKALGRDVSFVFADTFNQARRQSWSLDVHPSDRTQLEFTAYSSQGSNLLGFTPLLVQGIDAPGAATIPLDTGANGVDLKIGRKFP